jgi:ATP-dependent RNA helicase RhlE
LLKELLLAHPEMKKVLVFSRTKHGADKITRVLEKAGIKCAAIHGNKSQNRRQEALGNFKSEKIRVLVATDIAARGIDVDDVSHVFNYDLPDVPETFVHRIGRTARAGKDGIAISFCSPDEEQDLRAIEKLTRIRIPEGDQAIYDKLPPPQKETAESMMRNSRGRMNRSEAQARAEKSREKQTQKQGQKPAQNSAQKPAGDKKRLEKQLREGGAGVQPAGGMSQGGKPHGEQTNNSQNGDARRRHRRNRPGSRARRRMRENGGAV